MRTEIILSLLLTGGIIIASLVPSPHRTLRLASGQTSLYILMEGNYINPLFSSAKGINLLNGAAKEFALFAGYDDFNARLDFDDRAQVVSITRYSGDLLSLLAIDLAHRATINHPEEQVYISEAFWERAFASRNEIIGSTLELHKRTYRIAGVTRGFTGLLAGTDIWIPVRSKSEYGAMNSMRVLGALQPGSNWRLTQRTLKKIFRSPFAEQVFSEAPGARLMPLEKGVSFGDEAPMIAGRTGSPIYISGT